MAVGRGRRDFGPAGRRCYSCLRFRRH